MLGKAGANRTGNHFASLDFSLNWPHRYMESRPFPSERPTSTADSRGENVSFWEYKKTSRQFNPRRRVNSGSLVSIGVISKSWYIKHLVYGIDHVDALTAKLCT